MRDDGGVSAGYTVPVFYDSMIAKLVAWGGSRRDAIDRMSRALREYQVLGIRTTIPFFLWLMRQPDYVAGRYDTTYLDRLLVDREGRVVQRADAAATRRSRRSRAALDAYLRANVRIARRRARVAASALEAGRAARGAARMTFDIEINGRARTGLGRASRRPGRFRVIVDGHAHAGRRGAHWQLRPVAAVRTATAHRSRDVQVAPARRAGRAARAPRRPDGRPPSSTVGAPGRARPTAARTRGGEQTIVAPMPGRVVRLLVARGDHVDGAAGCRSSSRR